MSFSIFGYFFLGWTRCVWLTTGRHYHETDEMCIATRNWRIFIASLSECKGDHLVYFSKTFTEPTIIRIFYRYKLQRNRQWKIKLNEFCLLIPSHHMSHWPQVPVHQVFSHFSHKIAVKPSEHMYVSVRNEKTKIICMHGWYKTFINI